MITLITPRARKKGYTISWNQQKLHIYIPGGGGRLVYATARSFVAGGPEPQEGGGLGQAQTVMV